MLFDTGATFSCVAESVIAVCGLFVKYLNECLSMNTPLWGGTMLNRICRDVDIEIEGRHLPTNLVVLDMSDFDVFLGVDWLVKYRTVINYHNLVVEFTMLDRDQFVNKLIPNWHANLYY